MATAVSNWHYLWMNDPSFRINILKPGHVPLIIMLFSWLSYFGHRYKGKPIFKKFYLHRKINGTFQTEDFSRLSF